MNPDDDELRALLAGTLTDEQTQALEEAIGNSPELQQRLEELSGAANFKQEFAADDTTESGKWANLLNQSEQPGSIGRLGEYEIESEIAAGGMGVVFKGLDPGLQRTVAIKMMLPVYIANSKVKERFYREATAAAAIEHEHVLPIFTVDKTSALLPFFVMRYIEGESLETRLRREGSLPIEEAVRIARAIASGLSAAHAKNCVHRDIKPSNILLDGGTTDGAGGIWITDFGLVLLTENTDLTAAGTFLGTPEYCSPEQGEGEKVDHRSDLFSLGAVMYAMLAGKTPFKGSSQASLIYQIVTKPHTPLKELGVPEWLSNIVDSLLAKNPEDRPTSAEEVVMALDEQLQIKPKKSGRRTNRRGLLMGAAAAALAGGAYAAYEIFSGTPSTTSGSITRISDTGTEGAKQLASALEQSKPPIIELDFDGEMLVPPLKAASPLWLRAVSGRFPTLRGSDPSLPLLSTRQPLALEGVTLLSESEGLKSDQPLIDSEGAYLGLSHCELQRMTEAEVARGLVPLLQLRGVKTLDILGSCLFAPHWHVVLAELGREASEIQLDIAQSVLYGNVAVMLDASNPKTKAKVDFEANLMVAESVLNAYHRTSPAIEIAFDVQGNIFNGAKLMNVQKNLRTLRSMMTWKEQGNAYAIRDAYVFAAIPRAVQLDNLADWKRQWENEAVDIGAKEVALPSEPEKPDDTQKFAPENFQKMVEASGAEFDLSMLGPRGASRKDKAYLSWKARCEA